MITSHIKTRYQLSLFQIIFNKFSFSSSFCQCFFLNFVVMRIQCKHFRFLKINFKEKLQERPYKSTKIQNQRGLFSVIYVQILELYGSKIQQLAILIFHKKQIPRYTVFHIFSAYLSKQYNNVLTLRLLLRRGVWEEELLSESWSSYC